MRYLNKRLRMILQCDCSDTLAATDGAEGVRRRLQLRWRNWVKTTATSDCLKCFHSIIYTVVFFFNILSIYVVHIQFIKIKVRFDLEAVPSTKLFFNLFKHKLDIKIFQRDSIKSEIDTYHHSSKTLFLCRNLQHNISHLLVNISIVTLQKSC